MLALQPPADLPHVPAKRSWKYKKTSSFDEVFLLQKTITKKLVIEKKNVSIQAMEHLQTGESLQKTILCIGEIPHKAGLEAFEIYLRDSNIQLLSFKRYENYQKAHEYRITEVLLKEEKLLCVLLSEQYDIHHSSLANYFQQYVPCIIIRNAMHERAEQHTAKLFSVRINDEWLLDKIDVYKNRFQEPQNWLDCDSAEEQGLTQKLLEKSYEENNNLAVSDHNHRVVSQAIRMRIAPADTKAAYFEKRLQEKNPHNTKEGNFKKEWDHIQKLGVMEIDLLNANIKSTEGHLGKKRESHTLGEKVQGFAFDPVSKLSKITTGFMQHYVAAEYLSIEVKALYHMKQRKEKLYPQANDIFNRIISGFIYQEIAEWKYPILRINEKTPPTSKKHIIALKDHLLREQKILLHPQKTPTKW